MQRWVDIAHLGVALVVALAAVFVAIMIGVSLERLNRQLDLSAIRQEQALKDHVKALKDLEVSRAAHEQTLDDHRRLLER